MPDYETIIYNSSVALKNHEETGSSGIGVSRWRVGGVRWRLFAGLILGRGHLGLLLLLLGVLVHAEVDEPVEHDEDEHDVAEDAADGELEETDDDTDEAEADRDAEDDDLDLEETRHALEEVGAVAGVGDEEGEGRGAHEVEDHVPDDPGRGVVVVV